MAEYPFDSTDVSLKEAVAKIEELEGENIRLTHDLEECRDLLFDILQQENDIPEQRVKDEFIQIFQAIDSWIDEVSGDERYNFKYRYASIMDRKDRKTILEDLGLEYGCLQMPWAMKLGELETCPYIVLSLAITRCVVEDVFGINPKLKSRDLVPPGISRRQQDFIKRVEDAMTSPSEALRSQRQSEPIPQIEPSGLTVPRLVQSRYPKWRGETISALASTEEYERRCQKSKERIDEHLKLDLEQWLEGDRVTEHIHSLRRMVFDPAFKLLHMVSCSGKTYQVCLERIIPGSIPPANGLWAFKDLATWRTVPLRDVAGTIRYLYPGLVRKRCGEQGDLVLVNPVALGYCQPDLQPQLTTSQVRTRSKSNHHDIKTAERTSVNVSRTDQKRSGKGPHETSRLSNRVRTTDCTPKLPPQQALQDKLRQEHKQQKPERDMLLNAGLLLGLAPPVQSCSPRDLHPTPSKIDAKQLNRLAQVEKAVTGQDFPLGSEARVEEEQSSLARQGENEPRCGRADVGHGTATADPSRSSSTSFYGTKVEPSSKGYQYPETEQWVRDGGRYRIVGPGLKPDTS